MKTHRSHRSVGMAFWVAGVVALAGIGRAENPSAVAQSRTPGTPLLILPVRVAGNPMGRVSEVVGLMLERKGLQQIEIGAKAFAPPVAREPGALTAALGEFVRRNSVAGGFTLYAEFNGSRETGFTGLAGWLLDEKGDVVWSEQKSAADESLARIQNKEPMTLAMLLAEDVAPQFGLNEETARAAKPGKMARLMEERSGLPPAEERAALPERQRELVNRVAQAKIVVFPMRVGGRFEVESAAAIAQELSHLGMGKSVAVGGTPTLASPRPGPNEMKTLWDFARDFRGWLRQNPAGADYAVIADCAFSAQQWERGFVHVVVCDARGDWVIVDLQNSHQPDYQAVKPVSRDDCEKLVTRRLQGYLANPPQNLKGGGPGQ